LELRREREKKSSSQVLCFLALAHTWKFAEIKKKVFDLLTIGCIILDCLTNKTA
jgi:hypothetical protein